jgi:PAS domain S-box-containing protein
MVAENEVLAALQAEHAAVRQENQRLREQLAALTERTTPDAALAESEQRYRLLIESMQDGVFLAQGGKLVFANAQLAAMVGYTAAELIQRSFIELIAPEDRDMVLDRHRRRTQGEAVDDHYEFRMLRRDGQRVWGNMIVTVVHYEGENATMGTVRNISAQKQQNEELRIFRFAFETISDGVQVLRHDGSHKYVNQALCNHLGYTCAEMLQLTLDQVDPDLNLEAWRQTIWPTLKEQGSVNFEARHRRKDGSIVPVEITGTYMCVDTEEYIFAIARDISERKKAEAAARAHEEWLRHVMDAFPEGMIIIEQGQVVDMNQPLARMLNKQPEALLGGSVFDLIAPESHDTTRQHMALEHAAPYEMILQPHDKPAFPAEVSARNIHYQGRHLRVATVRDISERKQNEEHMRVLSALADNALDGVALSSIDGVITYANPAFRRMSGYGEQCVGTPIVAMYPPQGRAQIEQEVVPDIMRQGSWQGVIEMLRPDGSRWLAQHSAFVIRSESGEVIRMGNILHDVTEQRRMERDHAALQQQIIDAQRSALRELSTPLIPISDDVVIMPLIGTIDSGRAQQVMETLLEGVARYQASLAILDITGVSVVDTQVAQALISAAQAVRLLGAQVMLTGIQPQIAQTLVHLGVDLSSIVTRGNLQSGIVEALRSQPR